MKFCNAGVHELKWNTSEQLQAWYNTDIRIHVCLYVHTYGVDKYVWKMEGVKFHEEVICPQCLLYKLMFQFQHVSFV